MPSLEDLTTDQLLARARELEGSEATLRALTSNPKTRETVQRALKTLNPNLVIPEIDAKDSVRAEIDTERQERIKLQNQIQERDIRERIEKQKADVKSKYRLTDEDMTGVEALMIDKENPIPTYDAAARVYLASRQSATPTPASFAPPTFSMPEKDVWGKGIGNKAALDKIAMGQAFEAWNEISSGKVPGLGGARN
jgi:hypothetical protein